MSILFVCGRSGGHIFPALSFREKLRKKAVYFFIPTRRFDKLLNRENINFTSQQKSFFSYFLTSLAIILKIRPSIIFTFGGRETIFFVLLGKLFLRKIYIYEPNVRKGKANLLLSWFANKIFRGFPPEDNHFKNKEEIIGIPIRSSLVKFNSQEAKEKLQLGREKTILCIGGSQGASFINNVFLRFIQESKKDFSVIHLTGERDYLEISSFYNKINIRHIVKSFSFSLSLYYSASDIVVSRAGANTLAEIAYYGLPGVIIPYPFAAGHQQENAAYFLKEKAVFVFKQNNFSFLEFKKALFRLLGDEVLRNNMAEKMKKIYRTISGEKNNIFSYF